MLSDIHSFDLEDCRVVVALDQISIYIQRQLEVSPFSPQHRRSEASFPFALADLTIKPDKKTQNRMYELRKEIQSRLGAVELLVVHIDTELMEAADGSLQYLYDLGTKIRNVRNSLQYIKGKKVLRNQSELSRLSQLFPEDARTQNRLSVRLQSVEVQRKAVAQPVAIVRFDHQSTTPGSISLTAGTRVILMSPGLAGELALIWNPVTLTTGTFPMRFLQVTGQLETQQQARERVARELGRSIPPPLNTVRVSVEGTDETVTFLKPQPTDLTIESIYPLLSPLAGTQIDITGSGFTPALAVEIGGEECEFQLVDSECLQVKTPALPPGLHSVRLLAGNAVAELPNCLFYSDEFTP